MGFKALGKFAYDVKHFMIAEVPVQEYGDKDNDDLRERFGLTKEDFPAYYLFDEANKGGLKYSGPVKAEDISIWLRRNKVKMPAIGTIDEFDVLARQFLKDGMKDETIAAAKKVMDEQYSEDRKAPWYLKIMQKVKEKSEAFPKASRGMALVLRSTPDRPAEPRLGINTSSS